MGWSTYHPGYAHPVSAPTLISISRVIAEQWTPQANDLYDLLIATFSTGEGALADLETLKASSGLSSEDWDNLLQYTVQVCHPAFLPK